MKPEVEMYFTDPAVLSKKYHSQLSQVSGKFFVCFKSTRVVS